MNGDKKDKITEKLLTLLSNFGESLLNIEGIMTNVNERLSRLEKMFNKFNEKLKDIDISIEKEYKKLKEVTVQPFTKEELKELEMMDRELMNSDKDKLDLEDIDKKNGEK